MITAEALRHESSLEINLSKKITGKEDFFSLINESILNKYSIESNSSGLLFHQGGWVNPIALCKQLINLSNIKIITHQKIKSIEKSISSVVQILRIELLYASKN